MVSLNFNVDCDRRSEKVRDKFKTELFFRCSVMLYMKIVIHIVVIWDDVWWKVQCVWSRDLGGRCLCVDEICRKVDFVCVTFFVEFHYEVYR